MPKIKEEDRMAHIHHHSVIADEFLHTTIQYLRGVSNEQDLRKVKKVHKKQIS